MPYNCYMPLQDRKILGTPGSGNLYRPIILKGQKRIKEDPLILWKPILKCDTQASVLKFGGAAHSRTGLPWFVTG